MTAFRVALNSPQIITASVCEYLGSAMPEEHTDSVQLQDTIYFLFEKSVVSQFVEAVLFVDVDGVLYDEKNNKKVAFALKAKHPSGYDIYDRDCVASRYFSTIAMYNIQTVLDKIPGCALVLSSQWRVNRSQYQLRTEIFAHWPRFAEALISKTDDLEKVYQQTGSTQKYKCEGRAIEIRRWLIDHPTIKRFVIIDDMDKKLSSFGRRFIHIKACLFTLLDVNNVIKAFKFAG
jgi:hypothetical protein